jgi:hypothetical protein
LSNLKNQVGLAVNIDLNYNNYLQLKIQIIIVNFGLVCRDGEV